MDMLFVPYPAGDTLRPHIEEMAAEGYYLAAFQPSKDPSVVVAIYRRRPES